MKKLNKLTALQVERAFDKKMQKEYPDLHAHVFARLGSTQGFLEHALARLSQKDLQELVRIHDISL